MSLDAGEVYVVVGARLDNASLAKADAAFKGQKDASDQATAAIVRNAELQKAAAAKASAAFAESSASYVSAAKRGEDAGNRLSASNERWKNTAVTGGKVAAVGIASVGAALVGAAIGAASFDSAMRNVNSIAGLSEKGLKSLEGRVLSLALSVGKSPVDLANGLYSIVSSGFKANDAMTILTAGARAARAGLTDTATATAAITGVLNAYGGGAKNARKDSDLLFQTVNVGVENFEQLAGSIGKVLPQGKALGVSLQDLLAAQAALTRQGNSADEASTQLGQIFTSLEKPSKDLSAQLKEMGYESGQAAIAHLGLKGTLDALGKAVDGNQAELAKWFPNIRALRGVDGLEGTAHAADLFTTSVKAMDDATKGAGVTAQVYAEQQKSTSAQFDHLKASVDVAAITIGGALLPEIDKGIDGLNRWFLAAQKSGELQQWANEIANGVKDVVTYLHSLGPEAEQAFHAVSSTVQATIPFVEDLYKVFQEISPEIDDVAHAAAGLATVLGPGPILATVAAFKLLQIAGLGAQAGVGRFAAIMAAGNLQIAKGAEGGVVAGKITDIGAAAAGSSGLVSTFARGLVATIGTPTLIAGGVAAIVGGLLLIRSGMENTAQAAQRAVDALKGVFDARLALKSAGNDVAQAQLNVDTAKQGLAPAAVAVQKARDAAASRVGEHGQGGNIVDPAVTKALNDQRQAILTYQAALDGLTSAQEKAKEASDKLADSRDKLEKRLGGVTHQVTKDLPSAGAGASFLGSVASSTAVAGANTRDLENAAAKAQTLFDNLIKKDKDLTDSQKATGLAVGALFNTIGRPPKPAELKIIADDIAAGDSVKKIKSDLGWIANSKTKARVTPDVAAAQAALQATEAQKENLAKPATVKIKADTSSVSAGIAAIHHLLASNPFTVKINEAAGTTGHFNTKGQWVYSYATGHKTDGPEIALIGEGAAPEYVIPTEPAHRAAGIALWMGAAQDLGIPGFAGGTRKPGSGGMMQPLFTHEGPDVYAAAHHYFAPYAKAPIDEGIGPYQTELNPANEAKFRAWNGKNHTYFNPNARIVDYDMRGYWLSIGRPSGVTHKDGLHFTDRFKTPYDATFSAQSMYALPGMPIDWVGNRLINHKTGQLVFGAPMNAYAAGVKKPGKTPPPIKHGLGYDPAALDAQMAAEKTKVDNARAYRDTLTGRIASDSGHEKTLKKEIATAQGSVTKANARSEKTASEKASKSAAQRVASKRLATLQGELEKLDKKLSEERQAHKHQVDIVIPAEIKRYEAATRAAKVGDDHAKEITLWQDRADTSTNVMSTASDQWDAANRKGDKKGMASAYAAWDDARKNRITDLGQVKKLLQEVMAVVGKTDYGAKISGQLASTLGDIVQAQDDTQAPGYVDASTPSTSLADYLNPFEITEQQQVAYAQAVAQGAVDAAAATADTSDDAGAQGALVAADTTALGVAQQIADRISASGAPVDVITQAVEAVNSAREQLTSDSAAAATATSTVTADQQAQIDQANANATAANENASSAASALQAYQQSGDLFGGGGTQITNHFSILTADNPSVQRALSDTIVRSIGNQPAVASSRGFYNG